MTRTLSPCTRTIAATVRWSFRKMHRESLLLIPFVFAALGQAASANDIDGTRAARNQSFRLAQSGSSSDHVAQWKIDKGDGKTPCSIGYIAWLICQANSYELVNISQQTSMASSTREFIGLGGKFCSVPELENAFNLGNTAAEKALATYRRQMNNLPPQRLDKFCSDSIKCAAGRGCDSSP